MFKKSIYFINVLPEQISVVTARHKVEGGRMLHKEKHMVNCLLAHFTLTKTHWTICGALFETARRVVYSISGEMCPVA